MILSSKHFVLTAMGVKPVVGVNDTKIFNKKCFSLRQSYVIELVELSQN